VNRVRELNSLDEKPEIPRWAVLHFNGATGITGAMTIYAPTVESAIENCGIPKDLIYAVALWAQIEAIGDQLAQVKVEVSLHEMNKH
jgi:hypothetical protein